MIRIENIWSFNLIWCHLNSAFELKPNFYRIIRCSQPNYSINFALNLFGFIHRINVAFNSHFNFFYYYFNLIGCGITSTYESIVKVFILRESPAVFLFWGHIYNIANVFSVSVFVCSKYCLKDVWHHLKAIVNLFSYEKSDLISA